MYFKTNKHITMKKRIVTLCLLLFGALIGLQSCDDEKNITFDKLPQTARQFIGNYFPDQTVNRTRQEKDNGIVSYEVRLTDGTEIDFNAAGEWQHIDRPFGIIPDEIVPQAILNDLAGRYPEARVHEIEKELGGYEIGIGNGLELYYTTEGVFIREER